MKYKCLGFVYLLFLKWINLYMIWDSLANTNTKLSKPVFIEFWNLQDMQRYKADVNQK